MVTVPLGADGKIKHLQLRRRRPHAIVDVLGWYAKDDSGAGAIGGIGRAVPLDRRSGDPERIYDSRNDPVNGNLPFQGGDYIEFTDTWDSRGRRATAVKAYAVTITAVERHGLGRAHGVGRRCASPSRHASTVNYIKGTIAPNMAVVPAGHYARWPTTGLPHPEHRQRRGAHRRRPRSATTSPTTRRACASSRSHRAAAPSGSSTPATAPALSGAVRRPKQARTAPATQRRVDRLALPSSATPPGSPRPTRTFLTVWSGDEPRCPLASNLNVNAGRDPRGVDLRTAGVLTRVHQRTAPSTSTTTPGRMHVLFDAAGTLDLYPSQQPSAAAARRVPRPARDAPAGAPSRRAFVDGLKGTHGRRAPDQRTRLSG